VKNTSIRGVFICTAALLAAVLGDAVVEGVSNAGILWHGHYTDQSSLDLVPVLVLAAIGGVITLGLFVRRHLAPGLAPTMRALLLSTSKFLAPREIARLLPAILALQMLVLFGMETAEQFVVYGHTFGGTLWLGGPIAASLFVHALLTAGCAFSISSAVTAVANALTRIVKCIFAWFVALVRASPAMAICNERLFCLLQLIATASRVERGPPLSELG
jgi:hypothetical protein